MNTPDASETFHQEAQELLEVLEQTMLDLERRPGDMDLVNTAFRALHTIKGSGAMFGYNAVAAFTHHVETVFDLVRRGELAASRELIAATLSAKDHMRVLIERPDAADTKVESKILGALKAVVDAPSAAGQLASDPVAWRIRFRLAETAMTMGTNPLLLLDELRGLGTASVAVRTDRIPPLEAIVPTHCYLTWEILLSTDRPRSAIEDVFMFEIDDMALQIEAAAETPPAVATHLEAAIAIEAGPSVRQDAETVIDEPSGAAAEGRAIQRTDSIRVPAERLDEMMDRVGELMIAQSRLSQVAANRNDSEVKSVAEEIERLAFGLRDTTMGVRTMPIGTVFGRFRRLVHDLSEQLGKTITLTTSGEETELDKTMIERLADPLVHLIRNSIDHGLEGPQERIAAGKPTQGNITLTASHAGAEVLIAISDDGRGLDRVRIEARAQEQGLLAQGAKLSDAELFQVLFQPGFSTAREVTSLSGRGVGMDVVKRTIEGLRGKIDIRSTPGNGTVTTLRVPLTLAIIEGLLVRVGSGRYVLPLSAVEECVELGEEDPARSKGCRFLNIRGDLVPYLGLRALFNCVCPADPYQKVVIVSANGQRVGLVVDQVIGNHQTVIKSLSKLHADSATFSGATILSDGSVALIVDIAHLVDFGQVREDQLKAAG